MSQSAGSEPVSIMKFLLAWMVTENGGQFFALTRVLPTARPFGLPVDVAPSQMRQQVRGLYVGS
jgi:hypothetical protein